MIKGVIIGCSHNGNAYALPITQQIVGRAVVYAPDFSVHLGDADEGGGHGVNYWPTWLDTWEPLAIKGKYFPMGGNRSDSNPAAYLAAMGPYIPSNGDGLCWWHSPDPNVVIVSLDVRSPGETPGNCTDYTARVAWLDATLAQHASKAFKLVCWHTPPYSTGSKGSNVCARQALRPVLEAHGVCAQFSAHNHLGERFEYNGIMYTVSGGGGAPFHALNASADWQILAENRKAAFAQHHYLTMEFERTAPTTMRMRVRALSTQGTVLDEWTVTKQVPRETTTKPGTRYTAD